MRTHIVHIKLRKVSTLTRLGFFGPAGLVVSSEAASESREMAALFSSFFMHLCDRGCSPSDGQTRSHRSLTVDSRHCATQLKWVLGRCTTAGIVCATKGQRLRLQLRLRHSGVRFSAFSWGKRAEKRCLAVAGRTICPKFSSVCRTRKSEINSSSQPMSLILALYSTRVAQHAAMVVALEAGCTTRSGTAMIDDWAGSAHSYRNGWGGN